MHPDRVVVGTRNDRAAGLLTELYRPLGAPLIVTEPETAEMIKYASNAFLATKISFINAIANICDAVGADVKDVALGMGYDARIGFEFLQPGPGFGGSCFPKDCKALISVADQNGYDFQLLRGVLDMHADHQGAQYFIPHALQSSGAIRPVIHRDEAEHRPAGEGDAEACIAVVLGIDISLFQPANLQIATRHVVDLRLLVRLPLIAERIPQHIIEAQLPNVHGCQPEDRHPEIAAFDRWRPVVKVHGALLRLDDPVARIVESHQTTVYNANGMAGLALPGVILFQCELLDAHFHFLPWRGRHAPPVPVSD